MYNTRSNLTSKFTFTNDMINCRFTLFSYKMANDVLYQVLQTPHTHTHAHAELCCHVVKFNKVIFIQTVASLINIICWFSLKFNFCFDTIFTWQTEAATEIMLQLHNLVMSRSISQLKHKRTQRRHESRSAKLILARVSQCESTFPAVPRLYWTTLFNCIQQSEPCLSQFAD